MRTHLLIVFILTGLMFSCAKERPVVVVNSNPAPAATARPFLDTAATEAIVKPKTNSAVVISQHANLHSSANQKSDVLDIVPQDASVQVIKQRGVWFLVKTETVQGWMRGNTIRLESFNSSVPRTPLPTPKPTIEREPPAAATSEVNHSGATAKCRDGSLSYSAHRRGTCSHHGGVAEWY